MNAVATQPQRGASKGGGNYRQSGGVMTIRALRELYIDELKDLYNSESQLVKALLKMARASSSGPLRTGFEKHLSQTKGHVERLEQIFQMLDENPKGKKCVGMEGLVKEGSEIMDEDYDEEVMDAALISAAQRVEHYEIAGYGTVLAYAELLGEQEHASLLAETLEEEKETDQKLTELSKDINLRATEGEEVADTGQAKVKRKPNRAA
jgi:ferritin-like metal-binding protein YciE